MQKIPLNIHRISPNSLGTWLYTCKILKHERSCVPHRRRLHAGKDRCQSCILLSQTHRLAARTFPVLFIVIPSCRMLTGAQPAIGAVTEMSSVLCQWLMSVPPPCAADGHSAHPGQLRPGAPPAQPQRCRPPALRGAGAAQRRQGSVHLDRQRPQVREHSSVRWHVPLPPSKEAGPSADIGRFTLNSLLKNYFNDNIFK